MLNIKEKLQEIRQKKEESKFALHVIRLTPYDNRDKNFSSQIKKHKKNIAFCEKEIKEILLKRNDL